MECVVLFCPPFSVLLFSSVHHVSFLFSVLFSFAFLGGTATSAALGLSTEGIRDLLRSQQQQNNAASPLNIPSENRPVEVDSDSDSDSGWEMSHSPPPTTATATAAAAAAAAATAAEELGWEDEWEDAQEEAEAGERPGRFGSCATVF